MTIWLINPYGPLPSEGWRQYRFAALGRQLARAGHQTVWWTSSFSHHFKRQRTLTWQDTEIEDRFVVRLVPTPGYRRNVGPGRIWRDSVFAWRAYRRARAMAAPDVIVTYESPLAFGFAGARLADRFGCRVIHDQMDLWPELFERVLPGRLRIVGRALLAPVYRYRRRFYRALDGVVALARPYLELPLSETPVLHSRPHAVVYNGIDVKAFRASAMDSIQTKLPPKAPDETWAVFAGSLGPSYDIGAVMEAAAQAQVGRARVRFLIAGDGPARPAVSAFATRPSGQCLTYLGQLSPGELAGLYMRCDIGLAAYSARSNVEMPDKFYDYTAGGLPIVNSLQGEVSSIIRDRDLGVQYQPGDAASLLSAVMQLASDPALRRRLACHARESADEYDAAKQFARYVELIERVAANPAQRQRCAGGGP
jgi:glycosyltransferase involved in cell wall biosynthesis